MILDGIRELYIPLVLFACLAIGYIMKAWIKDVDNKYIPTTLFVIGAILGCLTNGGITLELLIYGGITGLASTGFHQAFKQIIENKDNK